MYISHSYYSYYVVFSTPSKKRVQAQIGFCTVDDEIYIIASYFVAMKKV